jgi:hypothetical protein
MFRIHFNCYEFRKVSYFKCFKLFVVNIEENEDKTRLSMSVYELIHCVTFCSIMYVPKSCNIFNQGQSFLSNGNRRRLWPLFRTLSWLNPKSLIYLAFQSFDSVSDEEYSRNVCSEWNLNVGYLSIYQCSQWSSYNIMLESWYLIDEDNATTNQRSFCSYTYVN